MDRYSRAVGYLEDVSLFLLAVIAVHGYFSKSRVPLIQYCLNPTWPASCFKFSSNVTGLPQISSPCVKVLNSAGIEAGAFRAAGHGHWAVSLGTLAKPQSLEAAALFIIVRLTASEQTCSRSSRCFCRTWNGNVRIQMGTKMMIQP